MSSKMPLLRGPVRLSVLAAVLAFGAIGVALALAGLGVPFLLASTVSSAAAGIVQYAAFRNLPLPDRSAELAAIAQLDAYRGYTAACAVASPHDVGPPAQPQGQGRATGRPGRGPLCRTCNGAAGDPQG